MIELPDDTEVFKYKGRLYNLLLLDDVLDDYRHIAEILLERKNNIEDARKQAAREIVEMLRADRWAESELRGVVDKFGLEG